MPDRLILNAGSVGEVFDELPHPGDTVDWEGVEYLITSVCIINENKMEVDIRPLGKVQYFTRLSDPSTEWEKLPDKYLEGEEGGGDFTEKGSLGITEND